MSAIIQNLRERIKRKVDKVCKGSGKVERKSMSEIMLGIMKSKDIKLSSIGRSLEEDTELKYIIKRLSRNIRKYEYVKRTNEVMINETLSRSTGKEVIAIDMSDVIKEYGKKMENLCKVYDGSKKEIGNGYEMLLSSSIIGGKITPIYLETYSSKGKDYDRRWYKIKKLLNMMSKQKKSGRAIGTLVMDRGFDAKEYYKYMINNDLDFIVRLKLNRNIEAFKRNIKVEDVFDIISTREHFGEVLHEKKKKKTKIKIGYTEIKIEGINKNSHSSNKIKILFRAHVFNH